MTVVRVKTVNTREMKGVIVTAETLLDLYKLADSMENVKHTAGAKHIIAALESFYHRINE